MKASAMQNGTVEARKPKFVLKNGGSGIEVHEEELCAVKAQTLYKMRCECGRSWFELELPRLVKCPACEKTGLVSL
jgi:hypothetical protein